MTALIVFLIGIALVCNNQFLFTGFVLILCSLSIADKDSELSRLRAKIEKYVAKFGEEVSAEIDEEDKVAAVEAVEKEA